MADDFLDTTNQTDTVDQNTPIEAEIVSGSESQVEAELDWVGIINGHITQVDNFKSQLKKFRDMSQSIYDNDPTYQEHDKQVKEAVKVRNQTKKQLAKLPLVADLNERIADIRESIKNHEKDLSDYLQQYAQSTGATTFEAHDGSLRDIIYIAKLVKKSEFRP